MDNHDAEQYLYRREGGRLNAVVIICSRVESSRVPGKALINIAGVPAIQHIINRASFTGLDIVIAVPIGQEKYYEKYTGPNSCASLFSGNPESPLHRMADLIGCGNYEWIIRVTHDDILIDAQSAKELLLECIKQGAGYGSSQGIVEGAGVEVIHRDNLLAAAERRKEPTEFVSYFVRGEKMPRPGCVRLQVRDSIRRDYRLTLDYHEDALVLESVLRAVGPDASAEEVVAYLDKHENQIILRTNKLPDLSVYTCAYNAEKWIRRNIISLPAWDEYEHVLVNDASTDKTLIQALRGTGYKSMRVFNNNENLGLASSSNRAIDLCRGKAVMRLDADDYLDAMALDEVPKILAMIRSGYHVVYPAYYNVDENGKYISSGNPRTYHHAGGAVFDKSFLNELRFKDGLRHWDGLELYQRMVKAGAKIGYHDAPIWCYRHHRDSMSKNNLEQREREKNEITKAKV